MNNSVEYDHYPEAADNGKAIRRLELLGIKEELQDASDRRKFFANLTDEQFKEFFDYINSVSRGQKIEREYEDGVLPGLQTPPLEEKAPLMELAFQTVRQIAEDTTLEDHEALRRAGLTMAGAINYIHPKDNGNGRSGRIFHYLVEYGTERGDKAFEEEMYAIIGKLPLYSSDEVKALYDTPTPQLSRALEAYVRQQDPEQFAQMAQRERASARVVAFLDMMRDKTEVPVNEEVRRINFTAKEGENDLIRIPAGHIDVYGLFERDYLSLSTIPNRQPGEMPVGAHRMMANKPKEKPEQSSMQLDILD